MQRRALLATSLTLPAIASAQGMPRNIVIICPFAPGGPTDLISRLMAEAMGPFLEAQMVVENVTGAGGQCAPGWLCAADASYRPRGRRQPLSPPAL